MRPWRRLAAGGRAGGRVPPSSRPPPPSDLARPLGASIPLAPIRHRERARLMPIARPHPSRIHLRFRAVLPSGSAPPLTFPQRAQPHFHVPVDSPIPQGELAYPRQPVAVRDSMNDPGGQAAAEGVGGLPEGLCHLRRVFDARSCPVSKAKQDKHACRCQYVL